MKRLFCWFALCMFAYALRAATNPFEDGALSELRISVADDSGGRVSDASVEVSFQVSPMKSDVRKGMTDANGEFLVSGKHIGSVYVWVCKQGYYDTRVHPNVRKLTVNETAKTGRWSQSVEKVDVILKKVRHPGKLIQKGGAYSDVRYPNMDTVKGFDLKAFDWCPPHGKGEYADLQISTEFWRSKDDWLKIYDKTVITMTNGMDGAYFADVDDFSAMRHPYAANTNANFKREFVFEYDRRTGSGVKEVAMPKGKCLVFRTRTKVGDKGRLLSANYGIICETLDPFADLDLRVIYNPTPNDINLEGDWLHVLKPISE